MRVATIVHHTTHPHGGHPGPLYVYPHFFRKVDMSNATMQPYSIAYKYHEEGLYIPF
jgi:hypothetical protein